MIDLPPLPIYAELQAAQDEQLQKWLEKGFDQDACFVSGVSDTAIAKALQSRVPFTPARDVIAFKDDPNRAQLCLNYVFPLAENLQAIQPELIEKIKLRLSPGEPRTTSWYEDELNTGQILRQAELYALTSAIEQSATETFGVVCDFPTALLLAHEYAPEAYSSFQEETKNQHVYGDQFSLELDAESEVIESIKALFTSEEIGSKLGQVLQHRGALVFFNKNAFDHTEVIFDPEGGTAMVILSSMGLDRSVISGVELLT